MCVDGVCAIKAMGVMSIGGRRHAKQPPVPSEWQPPPLSRGGLCFTRIAHYRTSASFAPGIHGTGHLSSFSGDCDTTINESPIVLTS